MTCADYLRSRGWWQNPDGTHSYCAPEGVSLPDDPVNKYHGEALVMLDRCLVIQRARDAAEERRCVADAISNAASRHCKLLHCDGRMWVGHAADLALEIYRARFAVELTDEAAK